MEDTEANYNTTASSEGSEELNGKDASYRQAPMISGPRMVMKQRIRGALVPMRRKHG
jgi:hypothetical protein